MGWNGLRDRFRGSAIGTFVGDAMGRVVEGWPASAIRRSFGILKEIAEGIYTDDTEMMMGIMESLLETGGFDPNLTAQKFLHNFTPARGYGGRIYGVMDRLRRGIPWNQAGTDSWGNGSAMRVAPGSALRAGTLETTLECANLCAVCGSAHGHIMSTSCRQKCSVAASCLWKNGESVGLDRGGIQWPVLFLICSSTSSFTTYPEMFIRGSNKLSSISSICMEAKHG